MASIISIKSQRGYIHHLHLKEKMFHYVDHRGIIAYNSTSFVIQTESGDYVVSKPCFRKILYACADHIIHSPISRSIFLNDTPLPVVSNRFLAARGNLILAGKTIRGLRQNIIWKQNRIGLRYQTLDDSRMILGAWITEGEIDIENEDDDDAYNLNVHLVIEDGTICHLELKEEEDEMNLCIVTETRIEGIIIGVVDEHILILDETATLNGSTTLVHIGDVITFFQLDGIFEQIHRLNNGSLVLKRYKESIYCIYNKDHLKIEEVRAPPAFYHDGSYIVV